MKKTNFKLFEYEISNGEVIITNCDKNVTEVVIPSEIEGYPVTAIGEYAFYNCKKLKSVYISKVVKNIYRRAFYNCSNLKSVTIPRSVHYIAPFAFAWCPVFKRLTP